MMIISHSEPQQDTVKFSIKLIKESIRLKTFSIPEVRQFSPEDTVKKTHRPVPISFNETVTDTTSVCSRNSIADVTFYDSTNFILSIKPGISDRFPFVFTESTRSRQSQAKTILLNQLKPGQNIPVQALHEDWIILIILFSSFLYSLVRKSSKNMLPGIIRFFLFRGIKDKSSRDMGGLFNWQSTLLNLFSFLILGLFGYCFASFHDFLPDGISGIKGYLISSGIIIFAVTIRHISCFLTGNISGEDEAFREYLYAVYQSYRISAIILFIIVILLAYTFFLPVKVFFTVGIIVLSLMYLIRIVRLLIIFINRNLSIFYLILYLCALEILPVGVSVKYFIGLF